MGGEKKSTTAAGFEPTRVTPIDFESIALTTRPHSLQDAICYCDRHLKDMKYGKISGTSKYWRVIHSSTWNVHIESRLKCFSPIHLET